MISWQDFFQNMNWLGLLSMLILAADSLVCITFHELSHGYAAYKLGDPTAKLAGRLTLNPIRHIDPIGLIMMMTVRVGWAKPVPVDMRYFKKPKKGMALTALAGPASNFILAFFAVCLCGALNFLRLAVGGKGLLTVLILMSFFANMAILSVGLGVFNLIPLPPLDGSKILFSFLPAKVYYFILRYERYIMLLVVILTMSGRFSGPLSFLIEHVLSGYCGLIHLPESVFYHSAYILRALRA